MDELTDTTESLAGRYNQTAIEQRARTRWRTDRSTPTTDAYTIDSPPPTISGELHIGHLYMALLQDIVARFRSMTDGGVYFPLGFDDNGIASERLAERKREIDRTAYDRETFESITREVCSEYEREFVEQLEAFGLSIDTEEPYQTIEPALKQLSQASFLGLLANDRVYRERAPTLWCPACETAIAQAETEEQRRSAEFHEVTFELETEPSVTVATTRPELLPACVALFVHPEDPRADELENKRATVPLFGHTVSIHSDERVDRDTGTGIVMCCTFGDQTDVEWYRAHDLELRRAIDERGVMTELAGEYAGQSVDDAREAIVATGTDLGVIECSETISQSVGVHERCDTPIEFQLTAQWYCRLLDRTDEYLEAARSMAWYPKSLFARFEHWVEGLEWDWCLSRQRDAGVPIPVWYCERCNDPLLADPDTLPVDPRSDAPPTEQCASCGHDVFSPETDVFDTWATSAMTPLHHADWSYDEPTDTFTMDRPDRYPADLRPQGHDIISTWLFYTIVKCVEHTGEPPFDAVLIHGMVLDENREAMSKSKGNTIAPERIQADFPMDAIRYWAAGTSVGEDFAYETAELAAGERLCRKLWNATKLIDERTPRAPTEPEQLTELDRWLLCELDDVIERVTSAFERFEFGRARTELRTFFWGTVCDDYLEISKHHHTDSTAFTLRTVHRRLLELFAPLVPHLSDELYHRCYDQSVFVQSWPTPHGWSSDRKAGATATAVLSALRGYKSDAGMALNAPLDRVGVYGPIDGFEEAIAQTMTIDTFERLEQQPTASERIVDIELEYSTVGPMYGEQLADIEQAIAEGAFSINDGTLSVASLELDSELYEPVIDRTFDTTGDVRELEDAVIVIE